MDAGKESEMVNVLYSLMENRYSKKVGWGVERGGCGVWNDWMVADEKMQYQCSERLLRPQFKPSYYEELAHEMEEAPKRSWLQQKWLRLSQIVRFS